MYINEFIHSLDLLGKDEEFFHNFPIEEIEYKDYGKIKKLVPDQNGHYYLLYKNKNDETFDQKICIDKYIEYIHQLDNIHIDLRRVSLFKLDTAIYEAIFLFEQLSSFMNKQNLFCNHYYDINSLLSIYDHSFYLDTYHNNNPILRDVFFAQFQYFIRKYLIAYFNKEIVSKHRGIILTLKIRNSLASYSKNKHNIEADIYKRNRTLIEYISLNTKKDD